MVLKKSQHPRLLWKSMPDYILKPSTLQWPQARPVHFCSSKQVIRFLPAPLLSLVQYLDSYDVQQEHQHNVVPSLLFGKIQSKIAKLLQNRLHS